jgi:hypothetical protein
MKIKGQSGVDQLYVFGFGLDIKYDVLGIKYCSIQQAGE